MPGLEKAPPGEYLTDRLATEASDYIKAHASEPFFLYLPHYAVHTPLKAPGELVEMFPPVTTFAGQQNNPVYAAMLLSLDRAVGRILATLDEQKLTDKTLVIFTSDNGGLSTQEGPLTPATSNAPLREGKGWLYEGGIRIPLIVAGAGVQGAPREVTTPVISNDWTPTLCHLCGLEPPARTDGVDLSGLLREESELPARPLYWHYPHYSNQRSRPGCAIRVGALKLIEFYDTGRHELFDIAADPYERRNLALERPDDVATLAKQLEAWRVDVGAQRMTPNPGYRPNLQLENGDIVLPAKTANLTGATLRYEPLPHKETLGYWTNLKETATWDYEVQRPGRFRVEALVGCGKGSGGSVVEFRFGSQILTLTVPETGGFQAFVPQDLGMVELPAAGRYQLIVAPQSKPGPAVMDLRSVTLRPAKN